MLFREDDVWRLLEKNMIKSGYRYERKIIACESGI